MNKGWQTKRICDVSEVFDGPHATPKTVDSGPIFLGISALQDGVIDLEETRHVTVIDFNLWTRRVRPQPNDVVFSYETRLGQAAIIPEGLECCLGRRMGLIRFTPGAIVPRFFLYQYLSPAFRDFLNSRTIRGATVDRISIRDFPSFPILVPPLPEQQRIVGILDQAFEAIATAKANTEKNLQNARAIFESHLQTVFTKRGEGWMEKRLGDLSRISYGYTESASTEKVGPHFLRITDIQDNRVDWTTVPYCSIDASDMPKYKLTDGDIVFARTTGKSYLVINPPDAVFASYLIRVQLNNKELLPRFVNLFFQTHSYWDNIRTGVSGSAQGGFNATKLSELVIPYPRVNRHSKGTPDRRPKGTLLRVGF
jgi:type I restriction enzyme, S subunit